MKKVLIVFLCMALLLSLMSCSTKKVSGTASGQGEALTLPITKTPITLTAWVAMSSRAAVSIKNFSEILAMQELAKRTGITLKFTHPSIGSEKVAFNLMIASNDLPDLIWYSWGTDYPGGPGKAISDGVVIALNNSITKYSPNLSALIKANPDYRKAAVTDSGQYYMYPFIKGDLYSRLSAGFEIRQDWLTKLGLKIPVTIDDWYNVLTAFKNGDPNGNGKKDEIPYVSSPITLIDAVQRFTCAWGIGSSFYKDGNTVKFGPAQPEYKQFLTTMAKWYKEGLIDPDYLTSTMVKATALVQNETAGAYFGLVNSYMGSYTSAMAKKDPAFLLAQAPYPTAPDGKNYCFEQSVSQSVQTAGTAITSSNKYPIESAKLLDYFYSEEGKILMNLGVEGTTFSMVDGKPKFLPIITANPNGLSLDQAVAHYTLPRP